MIDPAKHTMETPLSVAGEKRQQAGHDIYVCTCPRCGNVFALNRPGKRPCPLCGLWIKIEHEDEAKLNA